MNASRNEEPQVKPQPREALFISHANPEDNAFSLWLGAKLAALGYEVWADVMRLHGGADWQRELEQALRTRAVKVIVVCTPQSVEKQGVRNEIEIANKLWAERSGGTCVFLMAFLEDKQGRDVRGQIDALIR